MKNYVDTCNYSDNQFTQEMVSEAILASQRLSHSISNVSNDDIAYAAQTQVFNVLDSMLQDNNDLEFDLTIKDKNRNTIRFTRVKDYLYGKYRWLGNGEELFWGCDHTMHCDAEPMIVEALYQKDRLLQSLANQIIPQCNGKTRLIRKIYFVEQDVHSREFYSWIDTMSAKYNKRG